MLFLLQVSLCWSFSFSSVTGSEVFNWGFAQVSLESLFFSRDFCSCVDSTEREDAETDTNIDPDVLPHLSDIYGWWKIDITLLSSTDWEEICEHFFLKVENTLTHPPELILTILNLFSRCSVDVLSPMFIGPCIDELECYELKAISFIEPQCLIWLIC